MTEQTTDNSDLPDVPEAMNLLAASTNASTSVALADV